MQIQNEVEIIKQTKRVDQQMPARKQIYPKIPPLRNSKGPTAKIELTNANAEKQRNKT